MTQPISLVAVSGSLHSPSKTTVLTRAILDEAVAQLDDDRIEPHLIELSEVGTEFAGALQRDALSPVALETLQRIEEATLLIVASPVYRASFTGLFKHVFDFVGQYSLIDKPVLLAATGGSDRHALILEHQFRPLFSFFQAVTLPLGVYAKDSDFAEYRITSEALQERIAKTVSRSLPIVRAHLPERGLSDYVTTW
jgi:FMN reductase